MISYNFLHKTNYMSLHNLLYMFCYIRLCMYSCTFRYNLLCMNLYNYCYSQYNNYQSMVILYYIPSGLP
ncbi:MAG: hypothetical protein IJ047_02730 [Paludibacteraceae bacterium]|nr:hypothetical protein [Paludibacteraceae bacterium]